MVIKDSKTVQTRERHGNRTRGSDVWRMKMRERRKMVKERAS